MYHIFNNQKAASRATAKIIFLKKNKGTIEKSKVKRQKEKALVICYFTIYDSCPPNFWRVKFMIDYARLRGHRFSPRVIRETCAAGISISGLIS